MNVLGTSEGVVTVEVTREIRTGGLYHISSSYGFAGVTPGIVQVTAIWTAKDITNIAGDDDVADAIGYIESYKDAMLSMLMDRDGTPNEPEYSEELSRLDDSVWVVYEYKHEPSEKGMVYAFPLEEFVGHTSTIL